MGELLGANKLVIGSYLLENQNLMVNLRIIQTHTSLIDSLVITKVYNANNTFNMFKSIGLKILNKFNVDQEGINEFNSLFAQYETFQNKAFNLLLNGMLKQDKKSYKEAIDIFNQVIEIDSAYGIGYFFRGTSKSEIGDNKGSIQDLVKAENTIYQDDVYFLIGSCYEKLEDSNNAIEFYSKVRDSKEHGYDASLRLQKLMQKATVSVAELEEFKTEFQNTIQQNVQSLELLKEQIKNKDDAINNLKESLNLKEQRLESLENQVNILQQNNDTLKKQLVHTKKKLNKVAKNPPTKIVYDGKELMMDSDNDGVPDLIDKEQDSPAGAEVDTRGVTLDSDKDGLANHLDKEPYSPVGYKIDPSTGISEKPKIPKILTEKDIIRIGREQDWEVQKVHHYETEKLYWFLQIIYFDLDSVNIGPEDYPSLIHVATVLKNYPSINIVVEGHADARTSVNYNLGLSYKRAKNAIDFLVSNYGISRDRLILRYTGESAPLVPNSPNNYMNRRVEFKVATGGETNMSAPSK